MEMFAERRIVVKLRCSFCMKKWKEDGKKPEEVPRVLSEEEVKNGKCPDCGNPFSQYFPF